MRLSIVRIAYTVCVASAIVACVGGSGTSNDTGSSSSGGGGTSGSGTGIGTVPGRPPSTTKPPPPMRDAGIPKADAGKPGGMCSGTLQQDIIVSATCQACLEEACCAELKACFNKTAAAGKLDCNGYTACYDGCATAPDPTSCAAGCESTAEPGIAAAFEAISACGTDNCADDCQ